MHQRKHKRKIRNETRSDQSPNQRQGGGGDSDDANASDNAVVPQRWKTDSDAQNDNGSGG